MSIDLATFRPMPDDEAANNLYVTAFHGGRKYGRAVQLSIGTGLAVNYTALSEAQCIRLAALLLKRVTENLNENADEEEVQP